MNNRFSTDSLRLASALFPRYSTSMGLDFLSDGRALVLAPLAGYSVRPFRRICLLHGAAAVWSGMISADGLVRGDGESRRMARFTDDERPIGLQLFGADGEVLARAAEMISELKPDFIDLNAGCPVRKVCKRNGGAALLKDPDRLGRIVEGMIAAARVPLTVKIRVGWWREECNHLVVAPILEEAGAAALSVHARTRAQRYEGTARWEHITEVVDSVSIPVVGNGDVNSPEDAEEMFRQTGCAAVMIGRAAVGNPWIFERTNARLRSEDDIPPPTPAERAALCLRHAQDLVAERVAEQNEERAIREFRKFVVQYSKGLPYSSRLRRHLSDLSSVEMLRRILEEMLESAEEERESA